VSSIGVWHSCEGNIVLKSRRIGLHSSNFLDALLEQLTVLLEHFNFSRFDLFQKDNFKLVLV